MHEQGPAMPQPSTGPAPTRAGRVLPRDDWRMMKSGATGGTITRGADGRMSYSDPVFQTDDQAAGPLIVLGEVTDGLDRLSGCAHTCVTEVRIVVGPNK